MKGLEATRLSVTGHSRPRLDEVSLRLVPGEVTVLLGENGAGKSTLLNCLSGVTPPNEGAVTLDGVPLSTLAPRQRASQIASLGQGDTGAEHLLVTARIAQGLAPRRGPAALLDDATAARVEQVARELGVEALHARPLFSLSGGERRRVEVARALIDEEAKAVLIDEPFSGVDVRHAEYVARALRRRAARGVIVVASLHDLGQVFLCADRILGLRAGRLVVDEPVTEQLDPRFIERLYGVRGEVVHLSDGTRGIVLSRPSSVVTVPPRQGEQGVLQ